MIVIVFLLLVLVVAFMVAVIAQSGNLVEMTAFGVTRTYSAASVFLTGIISGLVAVLLLGLLVVSIRRARRRRIEHADLERRRDELEAERAHIDDRLGKRHEDPPDEHPSRFDPAR